MPETGPSDANRAFLFASGEMDEAESAVFERRLGEEQALRETLCQTIELMQTLEGLAPLAPSPAYQESVRKRLRLPASSRGWLARRTYRGHPALWSTLGAAAALLMLLVVPPVWTSRSKPAPTTIAEQTKSTDAETTSGPTTIEMAEMWSRMHNSEHLARAHDEENRRRSRLSGPPTVRH